LKALESGYLTAIADPATRAAVKRSRYE